MTEAEWNRRAPVPGSVCAHGSLERSCELCERDKEIAELKAEVERLKNPTGAVRGFVDKGHYEIYLQAQKGGLPTLEVYSFKAMAHNNIPVEVRPVEGE